MTQIKYKAASIPANPALLVMTLKPPSLKSALRVVLSLRILLALRLVLPFRAWLFRRFSL